MTNSDGSEQELKMAREPRPQQQVAAFSHR
jgi:hypothetical protein